MIDLGAFVKERDEALLSLDKEKIVHYLCKYEAGLDPNNELVFWAAIHKAILALNSATLEQKNRSEQWLLEHGFWGDSIWRA